MYDLDGDQYSWLHGTMTAPEVERVLAKEMGWHFRPWKGTPAPDYGVGYNSGMFFLFVLSNYGQFFREKAPGWVRKVHPKAGVSLARRAMALGRRLPREPLAHMWPCGTLDASVRLKRHFPLPPGPQPHWRWTGEEFALSWRRG